MKISLNLQILMVSALLFATLFQPGSADAESGWKPATVPAKGGSDSTKASTKAPIKTSSGVDVEPLPAIRLPTPEQNAILEKFQRRLQAAGQVRAKVNRKTTVGLLGTEKKAAGDLLVSQGRVRMDLKVAESGERQLLVVGDKAFWAVTYPSKDLKGAAVQAVTGPIRSKKSAPTGFLALLGKSGFLKSFTVTGVALDKDGGIRYYLQPKADWVEAKRALLALGPELSGSNTGTAGNRDFREILIWDSQDNETQYTLESVTFAKAKAPGEKFAFSPPKNADVMSVAQ